MAKINSTSIILVTVLFISTILSPTSARPLILPAPELLLVCPRCLCCWPPSSRPPPPPPPPPRIRFPFLNISQVPAEPDILVDRPLPTIDPVDPSVPVTPVGPRTPPPPPSPPPPPPPRVIIIPPIRCCPCCVRPVDPVLDTDSP